jgi:uncharacterized lipoprotein YehR (DUF1307 family)
MTRKTTMTTWKQRCAQVASIVVVSVLVLSVAGCGKSGEDSPGKNDTPEMQKQRKEKTGD